MHKSIPKLASTREFMFSGVDAILGPDGLAERAGLACSAPQMSYAKNWCEGIVRGQESLERSNEAPASIVLSSADTGTGKTIGYGVPLLLRAAMGKKVAIATHSHALQRQFIGTTEKPGDIVRIAGWIEKLGYGRLTVARRLGKQAFVSASAIETLIAKLRADRAGSQMTAQELQDMAPVLQFAIDANEGRTSGLIEDLRELLGGVLPDGLTASSICLGSDSDTADSYAYDEHVDAAESANVVIVSHALIAASALYRRGQVMGTPIDCLVIDEADRLVDVAESTFRFDLSLRRCAASAKLVDGRAGQDAFSSVTALADYTQSLYGRQSAVTLAELDGEVKSRLVELATASHKALVGAVKVLERNPRASRDDVEELDRQAAVMEKFLSAGSANRTGTEEARSLFVAAISFSPVRSLPSLAVMPVNPGRLVARLWNLNDVGGADFQRSPLRSVLLTSATLGAPGHYPDAIARFKSIAGDLGIFLVPTDFQSPELDLWDYFEPEKFGAVRFILADPSIAKPVAGADDDRRAILDEHWVSYAGLMIQRAHQAGGRTLVLCNSYKDTHRFAEIAIAQGLQVIQQLPGQSTKDCEEQFLANPTAIWYSASAWEGLNLPGAIQNLVIPRLPFMAPSDTDRALLRAYSNLTNRSIEAVLQARGMSALKRKTRQGMFRPIRSVSDRARIWIADPRFPMHSSSQIPLRHPNAIRYSSTKRYAGLHAVIPARFTRALENAEVLTKTGEMLR